MLKIVLIGPESTGKTTLAEQLTAHFDAALVPEFARSYIDALDRPYTAADLPRIAHGQLEAEAAAERQRPDLIICDTDLIVLEVWAAVKFGEVSPEILQPIAERHYDLYLLCGTDIPWQPDPQRENPHDRDFLYDLYVQRLQFYGKRYVSLFGNRAARFQEAVAAIETLLL
jgi:NadR type nicotinamide-nucleotide adenylyltransferase